MYQALFLRAGYQATSRLDAVRMEISVHRRFQAPGEPRMKERPTQAGQLVLSYSNQRQPKMCGHRAQTLIWSFSGLRSSLLRSDRTFVWAWICTDDTRASRLQVKGRRWYLGQNIGPAVAGSAGPAPPPLQ